jgi:hypothetical protein
MNKLILTIALMAAVMETAAQTIPTLDEHHLLLDGSLTHDEAQAQPFVFNDFREAVAHLSDTTTLYIRPWVYWVDNPDEPEVVKGENGREPFGIVIRAKKLDFIGLAERPEDVVLAAQRGQTQGAIGNFTMFDMHVDELRVENMTLGNYCNVDLDYPRRPELSRKKRNNAITQAHVGYVHGRSLHAKKVRFISRLNLNPLNGARESVYDSCIYSCRVSIISSNSSSAIVATSNEHCSHHNSCNKNHNLFHRFLILNFNFCYVSYNRTSYYLYHASIILYRRTQN